MFSTFVVPDIGNASTITIEGDEAHHAIKVLRLAIGEEIVLTDGKGNWAQASVSEIGKKYFDVTVSFRAIEFICIEICEKVSVSSAVNAHDCCIGVINRPTNIIVATKVCSPRGACRNGCKAR